MKLIRREAHSDAVAAYVAETGTLVASALLRTEALRAARREGPPFVERARSIFRSVRFLPIIDATLEAAGFVDPVSLRTLDAIHLTAALSVGSALDALITYDTRMTDAARALGLPVVSPA